MAENTHRTLYCSFCGKSQHEVHKLIAGPSSFICDECVLLCAEIVIDDTTKSPYVTTKAAESLYEKSVDRLCKEVQAVLTAQVPLNRSTGPTEPYTDLSAALKTCNKFRALRGETEPPTIDAEANT